VEPYDLEIGPVQKTFDHLFMSIGQYFQSAPVAPVGSITEISLTNYSQEQLRKTLNAILKHYGFTDLPFSLRIIAEADSQISGIHRSDNITTYEEKMRNGSYRTFNFYSTYGPENMKASFYWLDMEKNGEQTQGVLTEDNAWYLRISTTHDNVYYQRIEQKILH
jgi:hypothetical protein